MNPGRPFHEGGAASKESLYAIIAALGAILIAAPQRERQRLAKPIEEFAIRSPTAFRDLRNGHPDRAIRNVFQEMMDGVDAEPD
jgi:hypothetical protein